jgi:hypothetical protein
MKRAPTAAAIPRQIEGEAMAQRNTSNKSSDRTTDEAAQSTSGVDSAEDRFIALAEQVGRIVGTMQAKADGWLDRDALTQQLSQLRDGATHLLDQLSGGSEASAGAATAAGQTRAPSRRPRSGGVVDAPGKKHRKPVPNQRTAKAADTGRLAKMKAVNVRKTRGR